MSDQVTQDVAIKGDQNIVMGKGDVIINPLPSAEARTRRDLSILLKNVEITWIKGVLEKSVHDAVLLDLGMESRADAVDHPWDMVLGRPDQPAEPLPAQTKIGDIFNETRLLLILGEPGSGKTITLLELARDLIERARADEDFTQPVPVVFNLSTWTNKQQPLHEWLVEELRSKYQTPKRLGRSWLEQRRILPLLDGLDEVKPENRAACVEEINQFSADYGLQGLVVCSRIKDYTALDVRLAFYGAIYLQPLTPEQIDEYFARAGDKLASLRITLLQDEALQSLAQSPLILNIMSLAYQDTSADNLSDPALDTDEARRQHLFETYIARMFKRRGGGRAYDDEQTRQRLAWLARNMQRHNQEVFLIEGLQPSWLPTSRWQWVYILASRLNGGLIFGLTLGLSVGLRDGLPLGLIRWLIGGLLGGLSIGFIDVLRFEWLGKRIEIRKPPIFWWVVINVVRFGLIVGLGMVLFSELSGALIFALIFGLRGSRHSLINDIEAVEALHWSWRKALQGGLIGGLILGLILGIRPLIFRLSSGLYQELSNRLAIGLLFGVVSLEHTFGKNSVLLIGGLIGGLIGAIFNGVSRKIIETKTVPNQGIRLSVKSASFGGLLGGLIGGLIFGLTFGLIFGLSGGMSGGLSGGLIGGLLGALWYGGLAIIQHYTLRLILILQGHTPRNYARFLDYAVDRIFLQKVGGGYRFIHRMLLEHFAELETNQTK